MPAIAQAIVGMTWLLDPTTPRYAVSGFHIRIGIFLNIALPSPAPARIA